MQAFRSLILESRRSGFIKDLIYMNYCSIASVLSSVTPETRSWQSSMAFNTSDTVLCFAL